MPFSNGLRPIQDAIEATSSDEATRLDQVKAAIDAAKAANTERLTTVDTTVTTSSSAEVAGLNAVRTAVDAAKAAIDTASSTAVAESDASQLILTAIQASVDTAKAAIDSTSSTEVGRLDDVKALLASIENALGAQTTDQHGHLEDVRAAVDATKAAVDTATAAEQAKLTTLTTAVETTSTTEVGRLDQVKAGIDALNTKLQGDKIIGHVSPTPARKVAEGRFYIAGATASLPGGLTATDRACFQLENPANSGKILFVVRATLYCDITQLIHYYEGATLDSPQLLTSATMNINRAAGSVPSVALIRTATAFTGGLKWPNVSRITDQLNLDFPPLVIPPGRNLSIIGTSAATQTLVANIYYYEDPIV